eukprot:6208450-Pleurochrysis_carterae.AAC.1
MVLIPRGPKTYLVGGAKHVSALHDGQAHARRAATTSDLFCFVCCCAGRARAGAAAESLRQNSVECLALRPLS